MTDAYGSLRFLAIFSASLLFILLHSGAIPPAVVKTRGLNKSVTIDYVNYCLKIWHLHQQNEQQVFLIGVSHCLHQCTCVLFCVNCCNNVGHDNECFHILAGTL